MQTIDQASFATALDVNISILRPCWRRTITRGVMRYIFAIAFLFWVTQCFGADNEFQTQFEGNKQVIQSLLNYGSDPTKPHPIEHHFLCFSPGCLKPLLREGESLGYATANIGEGYYEGKQYWYADLVKPTVIDLDVINQESIVMLRLANQFGAEYDGWGTVIVK